MKYSLNFLKKFVDISDKEELFDKLTNIGFNLEAYEEKNGDIIFELEITSNRPDVLSHFGLAREISALFGLELKKEKTIEIPVQRENEIFKVKIENPELCPRYSAILIEDVKISNSPFWLENQLKAIGIRPVNIIVDISNYILASIGHPTHPFDFDTISSKTVVVRKAREKEKIKTLDGVERTLKGGELLIADPEKPIGLAGIMGGEETEVKNSTKRVLFESAYFLPSSIRQTSRRMGIQTEASIRFGRGADFEGTIPALLSIGYLIEKLECGRVVKYIYDLFPEKLAIPEINFSMEDLNIFFGLKFDKIWVRKILNSLGFNLNEKENQWIILPPSYRQDIKEDVDIYEEIGRFYGYDKLPQELPSYQLGRGWERKEVELPRKTQDLLAHLGLIETISYIFSKEEEIINFEILEKGEPAKLLNPLSAEEPFLRISLIPGLLRTYKNNLSKNIKDLGIFEIGKVYYVENGQYKEKLNCGVLVSGIKDSEKNILWNFYNLKGILEKFIQRMGKDVFKFKFKNLKGFSENGSSIIEIENKEAGIIGEVKIEAPYPVWVWEISIDIFKDSYNKIPKFKPISSYPAVEIDMTIGHPFDFYYENIIEAIKSQNPENLISINFKDRFIKENKIFTTITLKFQSFERSLTQEEVNKIREDLAKYLISNHSIIF